MAIKEVPTNFRVYFKAFKEAIKLRHDKAVESYNATKELNEKLYSEVSHNVNQYKNCFRINLNDYSEFVENKYIDGSFYHFVKKTFIDVGSKTSDKYILLQLYKLSNSIKKLHDLEEDINKCNQLSTLTIKEYNEYLATYYTEVHRQMILNGYGYSLGKDMGVVVVNRCKVVNPRPKIDYAATKANKAKLLAEGKRLYNQEEEAFCKANGLDYKAVDYRVYLKKEYVYEIPLIYCRLPGTKDAKFEVSDYRHSKLRGITNAELVKQCNNDVNKIINLKLDIRTKLHMCIDINKMLYSKFIRNEAQQPIATSKAYRKNR